MKRARPSKSLRQKDTSSFAVEFHASIEGRRPGFYALENLAPKYAGNGDDTLFYRIRFTEEGGFPHGDYAFDLQLTRIDNPNRKKRARDEFEEEAFDMTERIHFQVKFPTILHSKVKRAKVKGEDGKNETFLLLPNYQVHMNGEDRVKAIYFTLENNQLDERLKDEPLWHLGLDESTYWMPRVFGDRYQAIEFIHPDPKVPCGKPPHQQPQRSPRWGFHRSNLPKLSKSPKFKNHQLILKGRIGGTKAKRFAGFFKKRGLGGVQESTVMMKLGRICEMEVVIAYLCHYTNRIVMEVGWFNHPTKPYHGSSPDAVVIVPGRTFKDYPDWVIILIQKCQVDLSSVDFSKIVLEVKVSQTNCEFKAHYVAQLYQEMICTNTYCAELVKMCLSTGEIKVFRVYRNPIFESLFSECMDRVQKDLLAGKRYVDVVDHPVNKNLRAECMKVAMYYNSDQYEPEIVPISKEVVDYRKWKEVFETEVTKVPVKPTATRVPTKKRPRTRERSPPYQEGGVGTSYMESDLWRNVKRRTVAINNYIKIGDSQSILDANLIQEQIEDYKSLHKRLCKE
jgi:hypothetical protein